MRATCSLIRREFAAYFTGPVGYVALFGFLVLNGLLFWLVVGLLTERGPRGVEYPMQVMLGGADSPPGALVAGVLFWGLFPAVTGIITSRLIAEERGTERPRRAAGEGTDVDGREREPGLRDEPRLLAALGVDVAVPGHGVGLRVVAVGHDADAQQGTGGFTKSQFEVGTDVTLKAQHAS